MGQIRPLGKAIFSSVPGTNVLRPTGTARNKQPEKQ